METKKTFEELWKKIEVNFKWENIYNYMKLVNWVWVIDRTKDLYGIPNIETIKKIIKERMQNAYNNNQKFVSSGGFSYGYENDSLWLCFTIEEINTSIY